MNGLSKEKRLYIEQKSMELAKLKMSKFSTLGLSNNQQLDKKTNENKRSNQQKQTSQQYYNVTPSKARSMSYRDDHSHYSSQIKQINDLSEEEHQSVMYKSNWMIPQEEKPHGEDEDIKVSPFVKYHPAILEMKVKSQDKRGYLLQEHQRLKRTEKQYLENLKDSRQFSLSNTQNQFSSNLSKLNRTFNSVTTAGTDRRKLSGSVKKQQGSQFSQSNSSQLKGYTVPLRFNESFDDCINKLQSDLKEQSQVMDEENRISRLLEKSQKKTNPNYINIQIQSELSSAHQSGVASPVPNMALPIHIQNAKQATLSDEESVCSTDKHKQKLNELLCFSLQNLEYNDNIHNYGQNFGKYPKFYKYLTSKNSKAQEERDYQSLKIYHQQLQMKKELAVISFIQKNLSLPFIFQKKTQSQKQSPNHSPSLKKKGIFSQEYKTFGESVVLEDIPAISQFLQLQQVEVKVNAKELNQTNTHKKMFPQSSFNQKSNPISPQKIKPEDQKIKFKLEQDKMFSFNSSDINSIMKKGSTFDQTRQNSLLQSQEGIQFNKPASQVLQRKNTIRESEEKSQKFIGAFQSKYPYILKKLKQIYKEEKTTKPFTKNYDEVFLSIYDSLSRAQDSALDNHNKINK